MRLAAVPIAREDEFFAVSAEHREAVELGGGRNSLEVLAIEIRHIKVKFSTLRIGEVGAEYDVLAVGMKKRRKGSAAQMRDLVFVAPIGVHDPDFQLAGANETFM